MVLELGRARNDVTTTIQWVGACFVIDVGALSLDLGCQRPSILWQSGVFVALTREEGWVFV